MAAVVVAAQTMESYRRNPKLPPRKKSLLAIHRKFQPSGHPTARARTRVIKEAAKWLARATLKQTLGRRIGTFVAILEAPGWLETGIHYIHAFADPPKSLEELQKAVSTPAIGYDVHLIMEQTSAEQDGFPRSMVNSPENLVRIPTLKHWLITGWYMMKLEAYG